ncbi:MAG: carbohydrate ABC transporter permease [Clostridia bacterium]|nr:carbohydrate ABC transporter permease [Clostridia bacterium]
MAMKAQIKNRTVGERISFITAWIAKILLWLFMVAHCLSFVWALSWCVTSSFKGLIDFTLNPVSLPETWKWSNYKEAFSKFSMLAPTQDGTMVRYGIAPMLLYSFLYAAGTTFVLMVLITMCAYVISRYKFFGKEFIYTLGIVLMVIPIIGAGPADMRLNRLLGRYNNLLFVILTPSGTVFSGYQFLMIYSAFKGLSSSYAEAAEIDGAGHWRIFVEIMLPMVLPTVATFFILNFIGYWNGYGTFLIYLPSYPSLSLGIFDFESRSSVEGVPATVVMACYVIVMIPTATLYLCSQKLITAKFIVGGLKG